MTEILELSLLLWLPEVTEPLSELTSPLEERWCELLVTVILEPSEETSTLVLLSFTPLPDLVVVWVTVAGPFLLVVVVVVGSSVCELAAGVVTWLAWWSLTNWRAWAHWAMAMTATTATAAIMNKRLDRLVIMAAGFMGNLFLT